MADTGFDSSQPPPQERRKLKPGLYKVIHLKDAPLSNEGLQRVIELGGIPGLNTRLNLLLNPLFLAGGLSNINAVTTFNTREIQTTSFDQLSPSQVLMALNYKGELILDPKAAIQSVEGRSDLYWQAHRTQQQDIRLDKKPRLEVAIRNGAHFMVPIAKNSHPGGDKTCNLQNEWFTHQGQYKVQILPYSPNILPSDDSMSSLNKNSTSGNTVIVSIQDHGPGINNQALASISRNPKTFDNVFREWINVLSYSRASSDTRQNKLDITLWDNPGNNKTTNVFNGELANHSILDIASAVKPPS